MSIYHIGSGDYTTDENMVLRAGSAKNHINMMVPKGYIFNASVPLWLRPFFSQHDHRYVKAAAFHDYALHELGWPKELAAAPFGLALRDSNVGRTKRFLMVLAVTAWKWK